MCENPALLVMISHCIRKRLANLCSGLLTCVALTTPVFAHGDLHEQIEKLSAEIGKNPSNSSLYLRRANLYRVHREWANALADLKIAGRDTALTNALYLQGVVLLESGSVAEAKVAFDRCLQDHPEYPDALLQRARTFTKLERFGDAAADFNHVAQLINNPGPDFILERARCEEKLGNPANALKIVTDGIAKLGKVPALELYAIELETKEGKYQAALSRLRSIRVPGTRQIKSLALEGEILLRARKTTEARQAFKEALNELSSLPPAQKSHWVEVKRKIEEQLAALDADLAKGKS